MSYSSGTSSIITYMPKVKIKGKVKHFPYKKTGKKEAKAKKK